MRPIGAFIGRSDVKAKPPVGMFEAPGLFCFAGPTPRSELGGGGQTMRQEVRLTSYTHGGG